MIWNDENGEHADGAMDFDLDRMAIPGADFDTGMSILVIDEQPESIAMLKTHLADQGRVLVANSLQMGLNMARDMAPDLILLDVHLAEGRGFDLCRQLKAARETADIPILFLMAGHDEFLEVAALEAGAVDCIAKPLRQQIVRARVATQLALRRQMMMVQEQANVDGLTGLHNRRYFDTMLEVEMSRHRRHKGPLALARIGINDFQRYSDSCGHQATDVCLIAVAAALKRATRRPGETLARFGSDDFVAILPGSTPEETERYGQWITRQIAALAITHPDGTPLTVSIGLVSQVPDGTMLARDLLSNAEDAMVQARQSAKATRH
ncbi:MAG: GGDEF domain-containing protein [Massilia sp.]